MKKILIIVSVVMLFAACGKQQNSFVIDGKIDTENCDGWSVYLKKQVGNNLETIDSAVVENNKFEFTGKVDKIEIYYIQIQEARRPIAIFVENANIKFDISDKQLLITGTELNEKSTEFVNARADIMEQMGSLTQQYFIAKQEGKLSDSIEAQMNAEDEKLQKQLNEIEYNFLVENINNRLGEYYITALFSNKANNEIEEIMSHASKETLEKEVFKDIIDDINQNKRLKIGEPFVDLELNNPNGDAVKLSDYAGKGKYVLIDFWASWCKPCCVEMPVLVHLYENYKNKGLEIVGVSIDKNSDDWTNKIQELNMTWKHMSDLKFWDSKAVKSYAVNSIPYTVLLNPEGKIIEKGLRGEELINKIAELIK